jgi:hypothetical protein
METIFDHQPTEAELVAVYGSREDAEVACKHSGQDSLFAEIAALMALRGRNDLADRYVARIKDPEYRFNTAYGLLQTVQPPIEIA